MLLAIEIVQSFDHWQIVRGIFQVLNHELGIQGAKIGTMLFIQITGQKSRLGGGLFQLLKNLLPCVPIDIQPVWIPGDNRDGQLIPDTVKYRQGFENIRLLWKIPTPNDGKEDGKGGSASDRNSRDDDDDDDIDDMSDLDPLSADEEADQVGKWE